MAEVAGGDGSVAVPEGLGLRAVWIAAVLLVCGCRTPEPRLTVAAAANLTDVFEELGKAFTTASGVAVVYSFGATTQLAQQIDNSAPFDVFAAADTEHVDDLVRKGKITSESRAVYARGQLAVWFPKGGAQSLNDLLGVRYLSIANPGLAPYGQASIESLKALGLWDRVQTKVVYANSISMAKQHAATGNADAAITAYSLVRDERGVVLRVDEKLHRPLLQAVGVITASKRQREAAEFCAFLLGAKGREILAQYGYGLP